MALKLRENGLNTTSSNGSASQTTLYPSLQGDFVRKHPTANCEDCPLRERGRMVPSLYPSPSLHSVPMDSNGDSQPTLAFIGEAPGRNEIAKQEVFIGVSGQLLNAVLDAYNVKREEVFLGNATLCHYPDSMKNLPEEAIAACRPRLMEELTLA